MIRWSRTFGVVLSLVLAAATFRALPASAAVPESVPQAVIPAAAPEVAAAPQVAAVPEAVLAEVPSAYQNAVMANSPKLYYRLGESTGSSSFKDSSGRELAGLNLATGGLQPGASGGLVSDSDLAATLTTDSASTGAMTSTDAGVPTANP